ncbi:hypothetical protein COB11_01845 [Candidatus Aerophobetes bacterium]|uniref:Carbohydrate-binding domain-containing protein n=1 Tax=Aerophobetes bacterium TaxID=2030807 RepID=A0A2A4YMK1_UNCAE|nr:MAG: hypothetical protein COB11_01845 [Candidatus Aerophobetes bacterium]
MSHLLEDIEPLLPASFFTYSFKLAKKESLPKDPYHSPYLLPDYSDLLDEEAFADVAMCFDKRGIEARVFVEKTFEDVSFPKVQAGDSIELFFDTRDYKGASTVTKFCHHFVFLPKDVGELTACEITKFRGDDTRELADPKLLSCETTFKKDSYEMRIFIDNEALYGFDPSQFKRLGFAYRINRKRKHPQHFTASTREFQIERFPSVWATLQLK